MILYKPLYMPFQKCRKSKRVKGFEPSTFSLGSWLATPVQGLKTALRPKNDDRVYPKRPESNRQYPNRTAILCALFTSQLSLNRSMAPEGLEDESQDDENA